MKSKRRYASRGALILAVSLAVGVVPASATTGAGVDLDVVTKVVTEYQELLDSHWTDPNCSLSHCVNASSLVFGSLEDKGSQQGSSFGGSSKKNPGDNPKFTKEEADLLDLRDYMGGTGLPITTVKSTTHVAEANMKVDRTIIASVVVATTKTYDDEENTSSYMVDGHTMTVAPNRENLFVVVGDTVDPPPVEDHSSPPVGELENAPTDPPVETPFEALLGGTGFDD